jgi:hypothetical protein
MYDKQISIVENLLQNIDTLSDVETKRKVNNSFEFIFLNH